MLSQRNKLFISIVSILSFIVLNILIWRTSQHITNFVPLLDNIDTDSKLGTDQDRNKNKLSHTKLIQTNNNSTNISNFTHQETIEETIARINRNVIVTGTVIGIPGQESAIFQIEGMPDKSFQINTQLMDGFIITKITQNEVVLKNQIGNESFSLSVQ